MSDTINDIGGWIRSADAWIASQGDDGDFSRREILDPALAPILGDITGSTVLDAGCGEGRYARVLASRGAVVTGIDPVPQFIARARDLHPGGSYIVGSGEELPCGDDSFDIVLSYLSLVDIHDFDNVCREMCRVVKPTGRIVLVTISNIASTTGGWTKDAEGNKLYRIVDRYMEHFAMDLAWHGIQIRNYHRPLSALLAPFFAAGMVLDGFHEPLPAPNSPAYADEYRAPNFQILTLRRV